MLIFAGGLFLAVVFLLFFLSKDFIIAGSKEVTIQERISSFPSAGMPLQDSAIIYWNKHMVPFIEAGSDKDAAFLLGVVNAHLRLGQMEFFKMTAQGRLSEMAGPLLIPVDHGLRILDVDKSVANMVSLQDSLTAIWVKSYVKGINWFIENTDELPGEYKLFNIPVEEWTLEDVYRIARLASADLTWGVYIQALLNQGREGWDGAWQFFLSKGQNSIPSFRVDTEEVIPQIFNHISKSGSNSLVVSSGKSSTAGALMANDPHLGIFAPNMWFLTGIKSPSFHLAGMQIPGIPFIALGRNPDIAWGGTNMRSISSHLVELSDAQLTKAEIREEIIPVRYWFDKKIEIRDTEYGPVISDAPFLPESDKAIAIQWLGHGEFNEVTSFLHATKAKNFPEFRKAFQGYAVSGQNLVYADNEGNIGQIAAYSQPLLNQPEETLTLIKPNENSIRSVVDSYDLPFSYNPPTGYIASANNKPFQSEIPIAFEFTGYNRMMRMNEILGNSDSVSIEMLKTIQTDVLSYEALEVKELITGTVQEFETEISSLYPEYWRYYKGFDGQYKVDSREAVAFESLNYYFVSALIEDEFPQEYLQDFYMSEDRWMALLPDLLASRDREKIKDILLSAMDQGIESFTKYSQWGDMHRLLFGAIHSRIPLIGRPYRMADLGMGGSSGTLMKSAHDFSPRKHYISYGSNSRHISNMADIDENYFVLLGGQDGWLKSPLSYDQLELWSRGEYIRIPLRKESVSQEFDFHISFLSPSGL